MCVLYIYMTGIIGGAIAAALVMLIVGFFFATVSGYLVGVIGSSNNPISGLTLSTLVIAALLMVSLGVSGTSGVVAVLAVAAVVCVSSAVAGELLQDFKVGYILGGTPRTIQITELIAVVVASCVMYFPLLWLHVGNINKGGIGFGDKDLSAPQAGLMASLAQGIVGGDMAWPLVITGILMGIAMIMFKVRSPMLVAIGMYLPIGTTSAIFIGGMIRWVTDSIRKRQTFNDAQTARIENVGVLVASGLIAGEALSGLVIGWFNYQVRQAALGPGASVVPGRRGDDRVARTHADSYPAGQCGRSERARSADSYHVVMRPRDTSPEAWKVLDGPDAQDAARGETAAGHRVFGDGAQSERGGNCARLIPRPASARSFCDAAQRKLGADLFQKVFGEEWRQYGSAEQHA